MFKDVERPCEIIFCILGIQNSDLDEIAELIFPVGEWPSELLIDLLDALKCDGGEDEAIF
jgi:hypothetical protein